jgi:hypothetical protein
VLEMKKPATDSSSELFKELAIDSRKTDSTVKPAEEFEGTDNPRHFRVIHAARVRSRKREEIDRIAGCSNGPELIAELRRRGLEFPCDRVPGYDRDGYPIRFGVYRLTDADRRKLTRWLAARNGGRANG